MNLSDVRKKMPSLNGLSDQDAVDVLHQVYYPGADRAQLSALLGVAPPPAPPVQQAGVLRTVGDMGIKAAQGVVDLGSSVVGLGSLATGGLVGKGMRAIGYDPKLTNEKLGEYLSDSQKASDNAVSSADGFTDAIAASLQNPRAIAGSIVQSAPGMIGGMGVTNAVAGRIAARAALATAEGASASAAALSSGKSAAQAAEAALKTAAGKQAAQAAVDAAGSKLVALGAATEGAQSAGQIADDAQAAGRSYGDYALPALAAGAGTAAIGLGAGKLMGDAATEIATGARTAGVKGSMAKRAAKEFVSEGLLEEAPQSAQEQYFTNVAQGEQDRMKGVANAAGSGLITGGVMGAGMGAIQRDHGAAPATPVDLPNTGPLSQAANAGQAALAAQANATAPQGTGAPAGPSLADIDARMAELVALGQGSTAKRAIDAQGNRITLPAVAGRPLTPAEIAEYNGLKQARAQKTAIPADQQAEYDALLEGEQAQQNQKYAATIEAAKAARSAAEDQQIQAMLDEEQRQKAAGEQQRLADEIAASDARVEQARQAQVQANRAELRDRILADDTIPTARHKKKAMRQALIDGGYTHADLSDEDHRAIDSAMTLASAPELPPVMDQIPSAPNELLDAVPERSASPAASSGTNTRAVDDAIAAGMVLKTANGKLLHKPGSSKVFRLSDAQKAYYLQAIAGQAAPAAPAVLDTAPTALDEAAHEAATSPHNDLPEPTEAQKEAGNYKLGRATLHGLDLSIENPAGSTRRGTDRDGTAWETTMQHHYGYLRGTVGADKDHIDAFIGPHQDSTKVFVIDQVHPDNRQFDEHKVMLGFNSLEEAQAAYQSNYAADWTGADQISATDIDGFKAWLQSGKTGKPFAAHAPAGATVQDAAPAAPAAPAVTAPLTKAELNNLFVTEMSDDQLRQAQTVFAGEHRERKILRELARRGLDTPAAPTVDESPAADAPEATGQAGMLANATAPEHIQTGVDERELGEIVAEFNGAQAEMMEGEHPVSNIFQPPAKGEIVRLNDKAKVFHKEHGWMTPAEARVKIEAWKAHARAQGQNPDSRSANSQRVVLSLFDLSGEWSRPWEEAGYQVYRFDIQDDPEVGDVNNFSSDFFGDWFGDFEGMDIYAILAATPCTDFASSGARHFAAKDADGRTIASVKLVHQTLRTIEYFKPSVWALENPVGRIESLGGLPPWRLSFDPNHLGDPYTKKTLIWGRFNGDLPVAPVEPTEGSKMHKLYGGKSMATKNARSVTPEGFSYGFFMANNAIDHSAMAIANKYDRLDRAAIEQAVAAGVTEAQINEAVEDHYYMDMDDDAANAAIRELTAEHAAPAGESGQSLSQMLHESYLQSAAQLADAQQSLKRLLAAQAAPGAELGLYDNQIRNVRQSIAYHERALRDNPAVAPDTFDLAAKAAGRADNAELDALQERHRAAVAQWEAIDQQFQAAKGAEKIRLRAAREAQMSETSAIGGELFDAAMQQLRADLGAAPEHDPDPAPTKPTKSKRETAGELGKPALRPAPTHADLKRYTAAQAQAEWDSARPAKRGMFLARIEQRDSDLAAKDWEALSPAEREAVHHALNEDFYSNAWYINTAGQQISLNGTPAAPAKSAAQLAEEHAGERWSAMAPGERYSLLLHNHIGQDAQHGQYVSWNELAPELRERIATSLPQQGTAPAATEAAGDTAPAKKAKSKAAPGAAVLRQNYGVEHIDGYTDTPEFTADHRGDHAVGGVKAAFLKDTKAYLAEVAAVLQERGFVPHVDLKGKDRKPVSVSEAGPAGSGDVSLALFNETAGHGIYVTIGESSLRGVVPTTDSGIAVMMRVTERDRPYGGASNQWMPTTLSAMELASKIETAVDQFAAPEKSTTLTTNYEQKDNDGHSDTGREGAAPLDDLAAGQDGPAAGIGHVDRGDAGGGESGAAADQRTDEPARAQGARGDGVGAEGAHPVAAGTAKRGRLGGAGTEREGSAVPEPDAGGPAAAGPRGRARRLTPAALAAQAEPAAPAVAAPAPAAPNVPAQNFRITDALHLGEGSELVKFNDNLTAIATLKAIEADNRRATPAEQALLARYVGWGGLANAFPSPETGEYKEAWAKRGPQLAELLTPKEYALARRSTLDSHYTSQTVVDAMWAAAQRLGYQGGLALESSMGAGNFIGLMPEQLAGNTKFVGVEYDSLTARIATLLYPQETVLNAGFQNVPLPDGSFDLAIGNPPFGEQSLRFQFKPELNGHSIHNQFFLASIDAVKPGGLQVQVVSRYLLDKQDKSSRVALAKRAKLLGAIRLPDTAFKENARTSVVTDIVVLQRLTAAEELQMAAAFDAAAARPGKNREAEFERQALAAQIPAWVNLATVADPLGGDAILVNTYFAAHPDMVLGSLERSGKMAFRGDVTVRPVEGVTLAEQLARAVAALPQGVMAQSPDAIAASLARHKDMSEALRIALAGHENGAIKLENDGALMQVIERETPEGGYELTRRALSPVSPWSDKLYMDSRGQWYTVDVVNGTDGKPLKVIKDGKVTKRNVVERTSYASEADIPASMQLGQTRFERLKQMVGLRDLLKEQITRETENASAADIEANRAALAAAYKAFVKAHGLVNEPANAALVANMPDGALVQALEFGYRPAISAARAARAKEKARPASATPAPILSERVIVPYEAPTAASSTADALAITLAEQGKVDLERIGALVGKSADAIAADMAAMEHPLLFKDPESGLWQTRSEYLSGQVKRKLVAAQAAGLQQNVAALEAVQPEAWGAEAVTALLGSSWIPADVYAQFISHLSGNFAEVKFSPLTNSFSVNAPTTTRANEEEWSSTGYKAAELVSDLLNSKPIRVMTRDANDNLVVHREYTDLALLKARAIVGEFNDWVYKDGDRRARLVGIFNDKFNTRVNRQHDGSHLVLPGKVPDAVISMRRHQKNAIWRGISERFMLVDHTVGAGKTFTAIARAMERRRMGLSKKPAIVVPNHMVEQFASDVYRLYPGAKVLAAGKKDFERSRRRQLFAKIATGDFDIVIIPHSSFGFIGIAPETEERYLQAELDQALQAVKDAQDAAEESGHDSFRKPFGVKEAERLVEAITTRMDAVKGAKHRDRLLTFEQMGIDDLTVDEFHEFKNLFYSSRLTGVKGMGNKTGSQKAFDMYNKIRVLRDSPTGTVTAMTGTPISNSAVEMYTMMRYLAAGELRELGLEHFDAWRAQFVSADAGWEPTETGRLKEVNRLGRTWSNMRSLMDLYYSFTDSVDNDDIKAAYAEDNDGAAFPIPRVHGGDRQSVVIAPTAGQIGILNEVLQGFDDLSDIKDPQERNKARLRLMDRARKVSLDVRAADPHNTSDEKGGKLDVLADNVHRLYQKWDADRGTQLVFLDRSVPKAKGDDTVLKEYDALVAAQREALRSGDEAGQRRAGEALERFDPNEMEELRAAQTGGWNAYQQIKDNLIARGIPADEIRFVQEANSDAQKKALFDAVNDGTVRVLIGSTPRMGAGTNVQKRLVALHHADVTWKPSDIEQREGRIIRQGNSLLDKYGIDKFAVEILAYATERTIDAKMWSLNSSKLRTINGIRKYDGAFSMDFEDEESVSMAELAALASGDPLLLERVKLMSEIDKLELLKRQHARKEWGIVGQIEDAERTIERAPARIAALKADVGLIAAGQAAVEAAAAQRRVSVEGQQYSDQTAARAAVHAAVEAQQQGNEKAKVSISVGGRRLTTVDGAFAAVGTALGDMAPFAMTVGDQTLGARTDAARALANIAQRESNKLAAGEEVTVPAGQYLGLPLELTVVHNTNGWHYATLAVLRQDGLTLQTADTNLRTDTAYTTSFLRGAVDKLEEAIEPGRLSHQLSYQEKALASAHAALPALRERRGGAWPQQGELDAKNERLSQVISELSGGVRSTRPGVRFTNALMNADGSYRRQAPAGGDLLFSPSADYFRQSDDLFSPESAVMGSDEGATAAPGALTAREVLAAKKATHALNGELAKVDIAPVQALSAAPTAHFALAHQIGAAFGIPVHFVSANSDFEGVAHQGAAFLSQNMRNPELAIAGHETLHALEQSNPALGAQLRERIGAYLKDGVVAERQMQEYAASGFQDVSMEKAEGEVLADINGAMWMDPVFWADLARADRSLFRAVAYKFMELATRAINGLRSRRFDVSQLVTDVAAVRAIMVDTWAQHAAGRDVSAAAAQSASAWRGSEDRGSVPLAEAERLPETAIAQEVANRIDGFAHQPPVRILDTAVGFLPGVSDRSGVQGAVQNGVIYLFRDHLRSLADVQQVLFHELLHYGLERFLTNEQYITRMHQLYERDDALRGWADAWLATPKGMDDQHQYGRDYALAVAIDEGLARLAQGSAGAFQKNSLVDRSYRTVIRWLAALAQTLRMPQVAARLRGLKNEEARALIRSTFAKLEQDAPAANPWRDSGEGVAGVRFSMARQPNGFAAWFGGSKVVNEQGKPMVVYHGTNADFSAFAAADGWYGRGMYFTADPVAADDFANDIADDTGGQNIKPVYLSLQRPYILTEDATHGSATNVQLMRGLGISPARIAAALRNDTAPALITATLRKQGYDGLIVRSEEGDEYMALEPGQIKSAVGNNGAFSADNADIRFSRAGLGEAIASAANNAAAVRLPAGYRVGDLFNQSGKISWWHKTVGTMENLAKRQPAFARVYDAVQSFIGDISRYAVAAADLAPTLLPQLENFKDVFGKDRKKPLTAEDTRAIGAPIFEGTLSWARDANGKPVKMADLEAQAAAMTTEQKAQILLQKGVIDDGQNQAWLHNPLDFYEKIINSKFEATQLKAGVVWSDPELRELFSLNDHQIALYREFRAALDKSLTNLSISEMVKFAGKDAKGMLEQAIAAPDIGAAGALLRDHFIALAQQDPAKADMHLVTAHQLMDLADKGADLIARGYAPLSRFGKYTVYVQQGEEQVYFGMFETQYEASKMARDMAAEHPDATVTHGTVSEDAYKLFAGVSPETIELFGSMVGLDSQADAASTEVYQTYLKMAKNNRSSMKRLIQRKGIAGFSEDAGRVLAGFIYSNARLTAGNAHLGELDEAITEIPKQQGELTDAAMQLRESIRNPEGGNKLGGLMFAQFLGGSVASAMVNLTQPVTMTLPYLSQFGGLAKAGRRLAAAVRDAGKETTGEAHLDEALQWAADEGIVAPQEVHFLQAQAAGKGALRSGDGTRAGNARAALNNTMSKVQLGWGKLFAMAELTNRRVTFIAAYRTAIDEGIPNPARFAEEAVSQTQGTYNSGNKPRWARGAIGGLLMTFKQYSIGYLELLSRMAFAGTPGSKERAAGRRAALYMLAVLVLMSGADGLPFEADLEDVIDGLLQRMGYNFSTKRAKQAFLTDVLGQGGADFALKGISSMPGMPIDVAGRFGMGNLLPGTGLLTKKQSYTSDLGELAGPAGDIAKRAFSAAGKALGGDLAGAAVDLSPAAVRNVLKGVDMINSGQYSDARGYKVNDVTPMEGVMKIVGFQPNSTANIQDAKGQALNAISQNRMRSSEIQEHWAQGIAAHDPEMIAQAREWRDDWNSKNPETPIRVSMPAIAKRVRSMRQDAINRTQKTAPAALKAAVRSELSEVRH